MSNLTETQQITLEAAAKRPNGSIHPLPGNIKGGAAKKVMKALHQQGLIDEIETDVWRISKAGYTAIGMEVPQEIEDDSPAHGPGPDFSDDAVVQAWNDNMPEDAKAYHEEMNAASEESDGPDDYDDPPRSLFCPIDPADLPLVKAEVSPAEGDFEADVTSAEQAFSESNDTVPDVIEAISRRYVQEHGFRVIVENLEKALFEAFKAGQTSNAPKTRISRENSKKAIVMDLLKRPEGASLQQIEQATGWNANTVRGFLSLAKKKQGLNLETFRTRMVGPNQQGTKGSYTVYKVV